MRQHDDDEKRDGCTIDLNILVIGSINADHWYEVESYTKAGCTSKALSYFRHIGGKGLNQARALQQAGLLTRFLGIVGDDEDGRWLIEELKGRSFPTSEIMMEEGRRTGHVVIQRMGAEEPAVLFYLGANAAFTRKVIERAVQRADVVVLQNEMNDIQMVLELCAEKRVLFNPSPIVPHLQPPSLLGVEWLIMNEPEFFKLLQILQIPNPTGRMVCNADLLKEVKGVSKANNVIVTRGAEGSMGVDEFGEFVKVPAVRAGQVVDVIGAGDCFAGFMLRHLVRGNTLKESLRFAATAATLKIERYGAFDGIPTLSEVVVRMKSNMKEE